MTNYKIWPTSFIILAMLHSTIATADNIPEGLKACDTATVNEVIDGETLRTNDGRIIKLASIKAPEIWGDDASYTSWPHAQQSKAYLHNITKGKSIDLYCESERTNFRGEFIAHAVLPSGDWLQKDLLLAGAAYVFPRRTHIAGLDALYRAEDIARNQSKGLWAYNAQSITTATGEIRTGWFQIISGKIISANDVRKTIFLNFGDDWRKDFTVEISPEANRIFKRNNIDLLTWAGRNIEVRGWITWKGGPHIMLEGPGQIRLIRDQ